MIALAVMLCVTFTAGAKDLVVNDDFNTMSLDHWTPSGNPFTQWIDYYDVGGTGAGFCLAQRVHTGHSGGVTQQVFVIQGVTYTVLADFAYANC
jgi:hypothetical protein